MDIQYLAGFFDGEGSVSIGHSQHKSGSQTFQVRVQIGNTNLKVLKEFRRRFGGGIVTLKKYKAHHTQAYMWYIASTKAIGFLKKILPHLVIKKSQAEFAVLFQTKLRTRNRRMKLSNKEILIRLEAVEQMKKINGRGIII